ncbi:hypothetical protein PMI26_03162 [Pseudomonas sp. GM33]|nr:hypothetical protein PMI26_03162 [Pseudomonas sp. GM33]
MVVNDNAASLTPHGAFKFFASKLAPTGIGGHKKTVRRRFFCGRSGAYFKPDIFWMAPLSSASEQSAQVPLGGIELIPVMALARMPSRPPW